MYGDLDVTNNSLDGQDAAAFVGGDDVIFGYGGDD